MSKNTANIAQAISLLSDVLSREATCELNEDIETEDNDEYDDLKEQALEFGKDVADDLSVISDDLDRVLDSDDDDDDDDDWSLESPLSKIARGDADADADAGRYRDDAAYDADDGDVGNGEVNISDTESDADDKNDADDEAKLAAVAAAAEERIAELEKNKEELGDKIEDLTDTLRGVATQIENLNAAADTFVSEVESL